MGIFWAFLIVVAILAIVWAVMHFVFGMNISISFD